MTDSNFVQEDVLAILKEAVDASLSNSSIYQHNKVPEWTSRVIDHTLKKLSEGNKPFKYIVNCLIFQKTGAGFHSSSSCLWDSTSDGVCTYRWENKNMYCITTVFGCRCQ
ncbi:hypothetical protein CYY_009006 [Polysphondylium violaceum]|uniref:Cytoplasmic dynein light chain n=1 Tax=Polysphondylium violaceum TaxID=133409 RepID=A0A8J4UPT2_9MYCE|nr:hypothetical protein CYY_009006 [Polysphondylium violaceum]